MAELQSMTGFASAARASEGHEVACDIRSVNNKGLDIRLRLPPGLESFETEIKKRASQRFVRGSIQVFVAVTGTAAAPSARIDEDLFRELAADALKLAAACRVSPPTADGLLAVRGVVLSDETGLKPDADAVRDLLLGVVDEALEALCVARAGEGAALLSVLSGHLDTIASLTATAENDPANTPAAVQARLREQVETLMEANASLDAGRLNAEAAILATKADIREEIDRLKAHVEAARELLAAGGAVGRKLDFLAQEFNRETNTLCSKSASVSLTATGLELKAVIDQFREQVQNLQ